MSETVVVDKATKSQWILRIGLLAMIMMLFYVDNLFTNYTASRLGWEIEQNPFVKNFHGNLWLTIGGLFFICIMLLWGYAKYKGENSQIFLDAGLVVIAVTGAIVVLNGAVNLP